MVAPNLDDNGYDWLKSKPLSRRIAASVAQALLLLLTALGSIRPRRILKSLDRADNRFDTEAWTVRDDAILARLRDRRRIEGVNQA
jgi:hypothetical protein